MTNCICGHPREIHGIGKPCGWRKSGSGWTYDCDCSGFHAESEQTARETGRHAVSVQVAALERENAEQARELASATGRIAGLNARVADLERKLAALKDVRATASDLTEELRAAQRRIEDLEQAQELRARSIRQLQDELRGATAELRDLRESKLTALATDDLLAELRRRIDKKEN